jgi:hypothetical protein
MSSRVVGQGDGVVICEAVALAVEIAEKSQIAVQVQKDDVNAGTSSGLSCLKIVLYYGGPHEGNKKGTDGKKDTKSDKDHLCK